MTNKFFREIFIPPELLDFERFESRDVHRQLIARFEQELSTSRFVRAPEGQDWCRRYLDAAANNPLAKNFWKALRTRKRLLVDRVNVEMTWDSFDVAQALHAHRRIDGMLVSSLCEPPVELPIPIQKAEDLGEDAPEWWRARHCGEVSPEAVASTVSPLLRYGREIHVVCKYLTPPKEGEVDKQWPTRIAQILRVIRDNRHHPKVFLHTSKKEIVKNIWAADAMSIEDIRYHFYAYLQEPLQDTGVEFSFRIWDTTDHPDQMLERYLLTDIGGCHISHLLEIKEFSKSPLSLLDKDSLGCLLERYRNDRWQDTFSLGPF